MKTVQVTKSFVLFFAFSAAFFILAAISRIYGIEFKPLHFDESINGWFVMNMSKIGFYKYDPNNYHGPLYFYLLQLFEFFWGSSVRVLRLLPGFFSIAAVMLFTFPIFERRRWPWLVAFFILLSPAFIFFGRSGIHEMPFVFFQLLFALAIMRWIAGQKNSTTLGMALVGIFGVITLKETFAILFFASGMALLPLGWREIKRRLCWSDVRQAWSPRLTTWSILLVFLFLGLFSGFGRNLGGILDFVIAFLPWLKTGVHGAGHDKVFTYWLWVLWQAEPVVLLGVVLSFFGLFARDLTTRWISALGLVQLLVYSWIPYKTVWCILSLVWPFYIVLGIYLERILSQGKRWQAGLSLIAVFATLGVSAQSAWRGVYSNPIDLQHPFVYVNSTYEFKELNDGLNRALQERPELRGALLQVGGREQWPWPWSLRNFSGLNFTLCRKQILSEAFVYLCDNDVTSFVEEQLAEPYIKYYLPLRQQQLESVVYLKASVFESYFPGHEIVGPVGKKEDKKPTR